MHDMILETVARLLMPFVQLFGMYVLFHGHISPGGSFSGGTIIAASFIFYSLVFRFSERKHRLEHDTSLLFESGGALVYILLGVIGIVAGRSFLTNRGVFPLGEAGRLWSSGMIALITLGLGGKVAGTVFTLFQELLEGGTDNNEHH